MKRAKLRYIAPITISLLIPFGLFAATQFTGPTQSPTGGNTPGVIWNMTGGGTQSGAKVNIDGGINVGATEDSRISRDIYLQTAKSFHVDQVGAATYNMGNWGSGQQPLTFGLYGDLVMHGFGGATGQRGRVDAQEYCISGANCITAWPSGGGGGITTLTAGTGVTITNPSGPTATINATDLYVNTTGDTMTGNLTIDRAGAPYALTVYGGNGGTGAIYGNNAAANGFGGYFYGAYGVAGYTPNDSTGLYGGYFEGYAGGVNGIGYKAGNSGVVGSNGGAGSIGVTGYGMNGYGGKFYDFTNWAYVGGQGYSLYGSGYLYNTGNGYFSGTLTSNGNLTANSNICLGGVCRTSWPTGGAPGGASSNVQYNSGGAFAGSANMTFDGAGMLKVDGGNAGYYFEDRTTANRWALYSSGDEARLWHSVNGDAFRFHNNGVFFAANDITTNNNIYTSTGNIGARVTAPAYPLDVAGTANLNKGIASGPALLVNGAEALWYNGTYFSYGYGGSANYFADSVGLGVTDPGYRLDSLSRIRVRDGNGTAGIWLSSGTTDQVFIGNAISGNQAEASRKFGIYTGSTWRYTFDGSNVAYKPSGTTWSNTSDARLKDRIKPYEYGLDEISKLSTVRFHYMKGNALGIESDAGHIGLIAQQVKDVIPDAVSKDDKGYYQLDADPIIWASVNAIKELKAENDDLRARIEKLEARLAE
ncbi:MAG: tail fiber domain-containing protein [Patescibacteria group bacterium]|nr:tail fiber domain-containing protein [Patescibacteria group bacterium]